MKTVLLRQWQIGYSSYLTRRHRYIIVSESKTPEEVLEIARRLLKKDVVSISSSAQFTAFYEDEISLPRQQGIRTTTMKRFYLRYKDKQDEEILLTLLFPSDKTFEDIFTIAIEHAKQTGLILEKVAQTYNCDYEVIMD